MINFYSFKQLWKIHTLITWWAEIDNLNTRVVFSSFLAQNTSSNILSLLVIKGSTFMIGPLDGQKCIIC